MFFLRSRNEVEEGIRGMSIEFNLTYVEQSEIYQQRLDEVKSLRKD